MPRCSSGISPRIQHLGGFAFYRRRPETAAPLPGTFCFRTELWHGCITLYTVSVSLRGIPGETAGGALSLGKDRSCAPIRHQRELVCSTLRCLPWFSLLPDVGKLVVPEDNLSYPRENHTKVCRVYGNFI